MAFELKWGNKSWIYALALGLGIGMPILLFFKNFLGDEFQPGEIYNQTLFWNYYSPMLGYYVLISICQSHYFRRKPEPDMSGLFRQFVSIFGAVLIFYVNQFIMISIFNVPHAQSFIPPENYYYGGIVMGGHFTFIVFGFFIYGFDDFMFKGKLLGWMKNDTAKAFFWFFFIWLIWGILYYSDFGVAKAHSAETFSKHDLDRMLAISQWTIIISLLYALLFRDWLPELQKKLGLKNDYAYGLVLLIASFAIGAIIAYALFGLAPLLEPSAYDHYVNDFSQSYANGQMWHHILYMGTFPLIPAILIGVYTKNFNHVENSNKRVLYRLGVLIPAIILNYFVYHLIIARPEVLVNFFFDDAIEPGFGLFGRADQNWYHQLGLYFNFTVSIIPLTHHWFCGKWGFMKEVEDEPSEEDSPGRRYAKPREKTPEEEPEEKPIRRDERRRPWVSNGSRHEGRKSRREWG